jgi:HAD superfamily hydrolase (TIGR01509 family)
MAAVVTARRASGRGPGANGPAAVIFDMDGVLVDSEPVHVEATRLVLADHGVVYDEEDDFFGFTDLEVFRILRQRHGLEADEGTLARAWVSRVIALLPGRLVPATGVPEVLEELRGDGYRLALASGSAPAIIYATLRALSLEGMFEQVVSAGEVGRGKPAPDIFEETARRLGLAPAHCVVVEDSRNGVLAARAAGMACAAVPCASTVRQDLSAATVRLPDLRALAAWLVHGQG